MFELWVPITIFAAFLQCVRTAVQKHLTGRLSTNGASFVRFVYGAPFALLYLVLLLSAFGAPLPVPNLPFLIHATVGGVAQIVATSLLIAVFGQRNFAIGTIYSKTEAMQTALFALVILGEPVSLGGAVALLVSVAGVIVLSARAGLRDPKLLLTGWTERAALLGIASGAGFAIAAVEIRAASLSLPPVGAFVQAAMTLAVTTWLQTILMAVYLAWREPLQLRLAVTTWRASGAVGLMSVVGSAGWFTAMTLQNAAYVRTLGQVELVFTYLVSRLVFGERTSRTEIAGILLIVAGVVLLLNFR
jgi:drug/metabolite transporter (DMT)-like permease